MRIFAISLLARRADVVAQLPLADLRRRVSEVNTGRLRVLEEHGAQSDHRFLSDRNPGSDACERSHPCSVLDHDWADGPAHAGIGPVVIAGAEVCALRDAYVGPKPHLDEVVDPRTLADPGVVADL